MDASKLYGKALHTEFDAIVSLAFTPDEIAYGEAVARIDMAQKVKHGKVTLVSLAKESDGHS